MYTETEINDLTGFENGDRFESDDEVRAYFTVENMAEMAGGNFGTDEGQQHFISQEQLNEMARTVIEHRWYYAS